MSFRTVVGEQSFRGLVESFSIPAEMHTRPDGRPFASFGGVFPVHCCDEEQVALKSKTTHHYCDIFTDELLEPLQELAYVRLDENYAEKVFINRTKRLLLVSSDGQLAQWRAAPTFESSNHYLAGTPIVSKDGALISLVTARKGNHYAVSTFEGDGGYFETPASWAMVESAPGQSLYADRAFASREEVREYISSLPPAEVSAACPPHPVLHYAAGGAGSSARAALVAANGRQISHVYLYGIVTGAEYL